VIVAIDGPAGAGKSTVARTVAAALGATYLDSGAMYRAVALRSLEEPSRSAAELAAALEISLGERVLLNGRDVTVAIRAPAVGERASQVAQLPAVRSALVARQRALLAHGDWVAEGRDIGTVVAPDAELKVFLTAGEDERARRRARETGEPQAKVLDEQHERDARDGARADSPLREADGAVTLDTTELMLDEVVARIVELAAAAGFKPRRQGG
jgi:cytidylate kinase